ncbi:MAG: low-specificity L-threonine aldolase [Burkholderiaceae bacterium]|jgi:threonine aldolase
MSLRIVDLRSDTVTQPSAGMRAAMASAEVGDDVYGDDPTVIVLERQLAGLAGMEAGLFMPSGTQSNLVGLMTHCRRGEEYIVGQDAHTYKYEGGGAATLGSLQPQPIENAPDGTLPIEKIRAAIKPDDIHFAPTRLIALENTIGGRILPEPYLDSVRDLARERHLALHLDGARAFNVVAASGRPLDQVCGYFDSVSICLSKGLGAPVGSVLCGSRPFIFEARRWRKMVGGGMRQVGVLAAAGLYALEHNVERLSIDHEHARLLADELAQIPKLTVQSPQTNMVYVELAKTDVSGLSEHLLKQGIRATVRPVTRLVMHLDVDRVGVMRTVAAFQSYFEAVPSGTA